jgi:hypothetical protein
MANSPGSSARPTAFPGGLGKSTLIGELSIYIPMPQGVKAPRADSHRNEQSTQTGKSNGDQAPKENG